MSTPLKGGRHNNVNALSQYTVNIDGTIYQSSSMNDDGTASQVLGLGEFLHEPGTLYADRASSTKDTRLTLQNF